ncbi:MAG: saccharopine dehydrogenase NADP-binding domain-containing protein [Solirubrobacteraceae bacterium]
MADRPYDVVVFGATGFTGGLTAEYLARHTTPTRHSPGTRWALAGRNRAKLEQTRTHLETIEPAAANLDLIEADIGDPDSMRRVAESAKVVITTVGPYIRYGEPLVSACAEAGTDYVDLCGEPEFVDRMWLKYHVRATETGARLVHSCGFDSIPHDLGVRYTVNRLPEGVPITVEGFVRTNGTFSGGTYHSTVEILSRLRQGKQAAAERRRLELRPEGRIVKGVTRPPHLDETGGGWVVAPPLIDPLVVLRSARALPRYGPEFRYAHYIVVKRLPSLAVLGAGAAALVTLAQVKPTRDLLLKYMEQGDGPSEAKRSRSWFNVRFKGEGGGRRVIAEVSGGDPGYGETSKMLAEAALCLAHDELPPTAGQVTPEVAMGHALQDRLINAGIRFQTVSDAAA